jgi:hypothetical protein
MSSTCFKDKTPTNVTTDNIDESSESDIFSDSSHKMDDTSSMEDQKVTTVVVEPLELNTPRGVAAQINYSSPRKSEYY